MSKGSILVLGSATALTLMGLLFPPPTTQAAGRITSTQESTSVQEETAEQSKPQRSIIRLPTYYSRVVTQEQREEIYEIQETYTKELEAIEMELKNKQKERDLAIEAVLKPEQLEEVKRLLAEAKKRRSKKAGTASTEDQDTQTDQ